MTKISGVSKSYKGKKCHRAKRAQMPTLLNKKIDKKFIEQLKKHDEKYPTMSIRKTAKVYEVGEKTVRRTLKTFGKVSVVSPTNQILTERPKALNLDQSKKLLYC